MWTAPDTLGSLAPLDYPSATSDGSTLYATWNDGPGRFEDGFDRVVLASRTDARDGSLETAVRRPLDGPRPYISPYFPQVVLLEGDPAVLYAEETERGNYILFARRNRSGTWREAVPVAEGFYASLTSDDGNPLVAYLSLDSRTGEQAVSLARSEDGGQTWEAHLVTPRPRGERQASPQAARDASGRLHVVWRQSPDNDQRFEEFQYTFSDDGGATWAEPESVSPSRPREISNLTLLVDAAGHPHVFAFQKQSFLGDEGEIVHTARRTDGTWTRDQSLFGAGMVRWAPRVPGLLLAEGRLHATWSDVTGGQTLTRYASAPESWLAEQVALPAEAPSATAVRAFPNPTSDSVTVVFTLPEAGPVTLRVVSAEGRIVAAQDLGSRPAGAQRATLATARLAAGRYTVTFTTGRADEPRGSFVVVH